VLNEAGFFFFFFFLSLSGALVAAAHLHACPNHFVHQEKLGS
jgi:hypothetical protein